MPENYDVIVVGIGAMGSATCYELARRGVRVLGLEQFDIPHTRGSSHGFSRMIRLAYYEHADYVPLLRRAYERWKQLEEESGRKLLHITGGVYMGAAGHELVTRSRQSAAVHKLDHEYLERTELAARFGQFRLPDNYVGLYEPTAGWLAPEKVICASVEQAFARGAQIQAHEPVHSWRADASRVSVRTDHDEYHAEKLIFCGGPWMASLLTDLRFELRVTRQVLMWLWPREPAAFEAARFPCVWAVGHDDGTLHYGFPLGDDGVGLKIAHHAPGEVTDPDRLARPPGSQDEESVRNFIRRFLPQADGSTLALRTCLYTNSSDKHFIIDRHPAHEHVFLACGFSGHGFKFASVVGEILTDLAMHGRTSLPISFLSAGRFGGGATIQGPPAAR